MTPDDTPKVAFVLSGEATLALSRSECCTPSPSVWHDLKRGQVFPLNPLTELLASLARPTTSSPPPARAS